jgi:hypothetical protein
LCCLTLDLAQNHKKSLATPLIWLYPKDSVSTGYRMDHRKEPLMSHSGKRDKEQKEKRKKSKHSLKEKRKLKQEKHQQGEKKHLTIPG